MVAELVLAAYIVESGRALINLEREHRRKKKVNALLIEAIDKAQTWGDIKQQCERNRITYPELYKPIPPTWMMRLSNKFHGLED